MLSKVEKPRPNAEQAQDGTHALLDSLKGELRKYSKPSDHPQLRDLSWRMKQASYEKFTSKIGKEKLRDLKANVDRRAETFQEQVQRGEIPRDDLVLDNLSAASASMQKAIEDRGAVIETANVALTTVQGMGAFAAASALATPALGAGWGFAAGSVAGLAVAGATQVAGKIGKPLGLSERNTRTAIRAASLVPLVPYLIGTGAGATYLAPALLLGAGVYAGQRWWNNRQASR